MNRLYSTSQAAAKAGVTRQTIRNWRLQGTLPATRSANGRVVIAEADLLARAEHLNKHNRKIKEVA